MPNKGDWKNALVHLRLHFSFLLLPVFLFAVSQQHVSFTDSKTLLLFAILHLFAYPASNVFNSYYDNDSGGIGGLKDPPPTNKKMLWLANIFDAAALALALSIDVTVAVYLLIYVIASRLYSYRPIRLKQYAVLSFVIIAFFQGAFVFGLVYYALNNIFPGDCTLGDSPNIKDWLPKMKYAMLASSLQIGAIYPLTQIYQHKSDLEDGVKTLSYKLGYNGSFIFSGMLFAFATVCYYLHFKDSDMQSFILLMLAQLPIVSYFFYWFLLVRKDIKHANFKHTMRLNIIAAFFLNLFFLYLVIQ